MPHSSPPALPASAADASAERFFELALDLLCVLGPDGAIIRANPACERALGYTAEELRGLRVRELVHPDDRARIAAEVAGMRESRRPSLDVRARYRRRDGSYRWIAWHSTVDERGLVHAIGRDVTLAEEAQRELRLKSQILAAVGQAVIATDLQGTIDFWGAGAESLYGWRAEEALGRSLVELMIPERMHERGAEIMAALARGEAWSGEFTVRRKDGSEIRVLVSDTLIRDDSGAPTGILGVSADIDSRARMEQALQESERRYRLLLEEASDGIVVWDADLRITLVNDRACALLGKPREVLTTLRIPDLYLAEDLARVPLRAEELRRNGAMIVERRVPHPDGTIVEVEVSARLLSDGGGQGIFRDITARKHAETDRERLVAALQFERSRLAMVFEHSPSFTAVMRGPEHVIELANEACRRLLGERELVGLPVLEALPEIAAQGFGAILDRVLETGEPYASGVVPVYLLRAPGARAEARYVDFVYLPLVEADGTPTGIILQGVDVTEQLVATEALRETERQVRAQFDAIPVPVLALRAEGDDFAIVDHNAAASSLPRETADPLVLLRASQVLAAHPELLDDLRRCLAEPVVLRREIEWRLATGETRHFAVSAGAVSADRLMVHLDDVTERRRLESQLRQAQRMEAIGQLAGGVAHDFNNLLTVIKTYSELLLEQLDAANPLHEDVVEIQKAAARAASLTRQLLAFSRKQVLQPRVLDLNGVVAGMEPMLRRLIGEDIRVILRHEAELGRVKADPGQLEQVVMNLAVNARDAMPNGGTLTVETSNVVLDDAAAAARGVEAPGEYVQLAVRDTGTGMDAATRARIFEPFFTTKELGRGTGLGLSTVYGIVEQSGGHIAVESELGRGSVFLVLLPRVVEPRGAAGGGAPEAAPRGSETVLLVEDEDAVRALTKRLLERQGYAVVDARDGAHAIEVAAARAGRIDVLVTDMVMPGLAGNQLYARLRAARPELRVLYMSGYTDDEILRRGLSDGVGAFVQKPFTAAALASALRSVLDAPAAAGAR